MKESEFLKKVMEENFMNKEEIKRRTASGVKEQPPRLFRQKIYAATAVAAVIIVAVVIALVAVFHKPAGGNPGGDIPGEPVKAGNYGRVYEAITKIKDSRHYAGIEMPIDLASPTAEDYTKTNVQTAGLDEGDIVKTDGQYIYKLSTKGFYIISVSSGQLTLLKGIEIDNYVPREMYVSGDKLVLIGGTYETFALDSPLIILPIVDFSHYISQNRTDIRVYDISDKNNPVLERHLSIDGYYGTSRLIESENRLVYAVAYGFYFNQEDKYIPTIYDSLKGGERTPIPEDSIYIYEDISQFGYIILGSVDLNSPRESTIYAYLGCSENIYVSAQHLYAFSYDYSKIYYKDEAGKYKYNPDGVIRTKIIKLGLSDLKHKAAGIIDGTVNDRYWMDEYNGYLRVAAEISSKTPRYQNLYVLNSDLTLAGSVTNIAPGEAIYSVRFSGDKGSVVTFKRTDPYYSFDLSDPANPKITNEVKEDGVSHYIHYIGNTGYTVGIGRMSVVENSGSANEWVRWTGLKVSLYDNVSPNAVATVVIEGSVHSELFYNPKALLYDEEKGLIAFSYENWTYKENSSNYSSMEQGLAVFKFDLNAAQNAEKLKYRGTLTNLEDKFETNYGANNYYDYSRGFIARGIRIGGYIYTISDRYIKSYNLNTLTEVSALELYSD